MRIHVLLLNCCIAQAVCSASFAQCEPRWSDQFRSATLDGAVSCIVQFDPDGPGAARPQLIAAGTFRQVEGNDKLGEPLGGIAWWDGGGWNPLGKGLLSDAYSGGNYTGAVFAMEIFDEDGNGPLAPRLFAGGDISPPGLLGEAIVCWDGERWEGRSLSQLSGEIRQLAVVKTGNGNSILYAAGTMTCRSSAIASDVPCGLASYEGSNWTPVVGIQPGAVRTMAPLDDDGGGPNPDLLYAAVVLDIGGPTDHLEIIRVHGGATEFVAPEPPNTWQHEVNCLAMFDEDGSGPNGPHLFAGAHMVDSAFQAVRGIARWSDKAWETVGQPGEIGGIGTAMKVVDDDGDGPTPPSLFVAGLGLGSVYQSNKIARWDGRHWDWVGKAYALFDTYPSSPAMATAKLDGNDKQVLITPGLCDPYVGGLICWNGDQWAPLLGGGLSTYFTGGAGTSFAVAECFAVDNSHLGIPGRQDLIVGGGFVTAGDAITPNIARWDGLQWNSMGDLFTRYVSALANHDQDGSGPLPAQVYAAGYAEPSTSGFVIAAWTGAEWNIVGAQKNENSGYVTSMASFDVDGAGPVPPALVLAGTFSEIEGQSVGSPVQWDGQAWSTIGSVPTATQLLAVFDEDGDGPNPERLFGTAILTPGGTREIVRWNGTQWSRVGSVTHRGVTAMTVADCDGAGPETNSLLIACVVRLEGESQLKPRIAKWNGKYWTYLPPFQGTSSRAKGIAVMDDDGDGPHPPRIYVMGDVGTPYETSYQQAYVLDGESWKALGGGLKALNDSCVIAFDEDGPGGNAPSVFFGGNIFSAGETSSLGLARWGRLAPTILVQPKNRTIDPLSPVTFTVRVGAGNANSYQWRKNGRPLRDDAHIAGVHTDTLRITSAKDFDEGSYDVVVTNDCGTSESLQAQLTVRGGRPTVSRLHQ